MIRYIAQALVLLLVVAGIIRIIAAMLDPVIVPACILLALLGIGMVMFGGRWSS